MIFDYSDAEELALFQDYKKEYEAQLNESYRKQKKLEMLSTLFRSMEDIEMARYLEQMIVEQVTQRVTIRQYISDCDVEIAKLELRRRNSI